MLMMTNPPFLMDGDIRDSLQHMAQFITIQAQVVTTKDQTNMAQENKEVIPLANQHICTMSSRLIEITRINPLLYMGPRLWMTTYIALMKYKKSSMLWV